MPLRLSIPTAGDICPITLAPMMEDRVMADPNSTLIEDRPDIKKMTFPCNHSVGAMAGIYMLRRTGMRCPMCRFGKDSSLSIKSIPLHLLHKLLDAEARDERNAAGAQQASFAHMEQMRRVVQGASYATLADDSSVVMTVSAPSQGVLLELPMYLDINTSNAVEPMVCFSLYLNDRTALANATRGRLTTSFRFTPLFKGHFHFAPVEMARPVALVMGEWNEEEEEGRKEQEHRIAFTSVAADGSLVTETKDVVRVQEEEESFFDFIWADDAESLETLQLFIRGPDLISRCFHV